MDSFLLELFLKYEVVCIKTIHSGVCEVEKKDSKSMSQ